jgi:hypothetical protein
MKNDLLIKEALMITYTPAQLAAIVAASYAAEDVEAFRAQCDLDIFESAEDAEAAFNLMLAVPLFHTYNEWRARGLQVKRGERAALVCDLWKHTDKPGRAVRALREASGAEADAPDPHFYLAKSHLFARSQVEVPSARPAGRTKAEIAAYNQMLADQRHAAKATRQAATQGEHPAA